jgi:hypothetical protein
LEDDSDDDALLDENEDLDEDLINHGLTPNATESVNNSTISAVEIPIDGNISPLEFAAGIRAPPPESLKTNKEKEASPTDEVVLLVSEHNKKDKKPPAKDLTATAATA